jgi:hypothetical protein
VSAARLEQKMRKRVKGIAALNEDFQQLETKKEEVCTMLCFPPRRAAVAWFEAVFVGAAGAGVWSVVLRLCVELRCLGAAVWSLTRASGRWF